MSVRVRLTWGYLARDSAVYRDNDGFLVQVPRDCFAGDLGAAGEVDLVLVPVPREATPHEH